MKKLGSLFLWFCAASMIAQGCVLVLSYARGNLTSKAVTQIIALMNGIDIPGERLKNALTAARNIPVPTREEILAAKTEQSLEFDGREKALERWQRQLVAEQERLQIEDVRLLRRVNEFENEVKKFRSGQLAESLNEVQKILEILSPEQAKDQILRMLTEGTSDDVLAIIKGMPEDKRKKILAEFVSESEQTKLSELLKRLRSMDGNSQQSTDKNVSTTTSEEAKTPSVQ